MDHIHGVEFQITEMGRLRITDLFPWAANDAEDGTFDWEDDELAHGSAIADFAWEGSDGALDTNTGDFTFISPDDIDTSAQDTDHQRNDGSEAGSDPLS